MGSWRLRRFGGSRLESAKESRRIEFAVEQIREVNALLIITEYTEKVRVQDSWIAQRSQDVPVDKVYAPVRLILRRQCTWPFECYSHSSLRAYTLRAHWLLRAPKKAIENYIYIENAQFKSAILLKALKTSE